MTSFEMHPAVSAALGLAARDRPDEAARARASLGVLLEPRAQAGAEGFTGSPLSISGFPVEFAFSSSDPALRYTVDPGPPDCDPRARVEDAVALLSRLGAPPLPAGALDATRRLQAGRDPRFGVFIGGRHDAGGDRYKLYLEVPEASGADAEPFVAQLLGRPMALPARKQRTELIGVDPYAGRVEVYARIENMLTPEISALLWRADLTSRQRELVALLGESYPLPIWRELPGSVFGFSYSVPERGGGPVAFTLYTYARTMFGGDGNIRAKILEMGARKGWDLLFYERLTEPLIAEKGVNSHHTMFGITAVGDAPLGVNFGVTPPVEAP